MFVVENSVGEFLVLPEGRRYGSAHDIRTPPPEWLSDVDCATRFDTQDAARRTAEGLGFRTFTVLPLEAAWAA